VAGYVGGKIACVDVDNEVLSAQLT